MTTQQFLGVLLLGYFIAVALAIFHTGPVVADLSRCQRHLRLEQWENTYGYIDSPLYRLPPPAHD
jgi:hypothetical protein